MSGRAAPAVGSLWRQDLRWTGRQCFTGAPPAPGGLVWCGPAGLVCVCMIKVKSNEEPPFAFPLPSHSPHSPPLPPPSSSASVLLQDVDRRDRPGQKQESGEQWTEEWAGEGTVTVPDKWGMGRQQPMTAVLQQVHQDSTASSLQPSLFAGLFPTLSLSAAVMCGHPASLANDPTSHPRLRPPNSVVM